MPATSTRTGRPSGATRRNDDHTGTLLAVFVLVIVVAGLAGLILGWGMG